VTDLVRGMNALEAAKHLSFVSKRAARPILKLLNSAVASAKHDFGIDEDNLFISNLVVGEGPTMKRWRPRAYGRAFPIMKRTSHVTLVLDEKVKGKKKKVEKKKEKEDIQKAKVVSGVRREGEEVARKELPPRLPRKEKEKLVREEKTKPKGEEGILKKIFRRKSV
jgi:large subunit ribosomal protein L22